MGEIVKFEKNRVINREFKGCRCIGYALVGSAGNIIADSTDLQFIQFLQKSLARFDNVDIRKVILALDKDYNYTIEPFNPRSRKNVIKLNNKKRKK